MAEVPDFDPNKPFEPVAAAAPPPFDPNKPFEDAAAPAEQPTAASAFRRPYIWDVPQAAAARVAEGNRVADLVSKAWQEGFGETTPSGLSDANVQALRDIGIFRDPAHPSRVLPMGLFNEAVISAGAKSWQALVGTLGGLNRVGAAVLADKLRRDGESQQETEKRTNEFDEFSQIAQLALGIEPGHFTRLHADETGVREQVIGGLPRDADFKRSAELLGGEHTEANLRQLWAEQGIHPAEAVHDARLDSFLKHDATSAPTVVDLDHDLFETLQDTGGMPAHGLGADVTTEPPLVPLAREPAQPPGRLMAAFHEAGNKLLDIGRDAQMLTAPMVRGTADSMAIAKDFANTLRRNRWDWSRIDDDIAKRFTPEQRKRMWDAADEESVLRQEGQTSAHMGLATLEPAEREAVEQLQARAQITWLRARDLGMVEGEGLPSYTPRMLINAARDTGEERSLPLNAIGYNLKTSTGQMLRRKYLTAEETEAAAKARFGDEAEIARDIRALPLATARLDDAVAGRTLINAIKEYGQRTGAQTVSEGSIPPGDQKWFTLDHPAFKTLKKETKKIDVPAQSTTVTATHETTFDPGLQSGLERVASELGIQIRQPLRQQDPYLASNPRTMGYTSRSRNDVVSTFGNQQTILEHEIGHQIDFRYGLSDKIRTESPAAWQELGELALHRVDSGARAAIRSQPDFLKKLSSHTPFAGISSYDDYLLSAEERVANLLHAYWYAPNLLEKVAPTASKWFENFLSDAPDGLKRAISNVEPSLRTEGRSLQEQTSVMTNPVSISVDQMTRVPLYVHGDFEGPLRAVLTEKNGAAYNAMMSLKAKTMSLIMNSPLIHNAVEWGRALPSMPGKVATFKIYFEGNRAKKDPVTMQEAIDHGMVPIGHRFFNQDISSIMEEPNLTPGRSWTAQVLGFVPGLFDEGAGNAVKGAIDKAGNFWHNTLLWDRVGDLQAGLYVNFRDEATAKGVDPNTAAYMAAHWANRYAGALPQEAMSNAARKVSNMLLFSRSFTMGNLGALKDVLTGLPKDVLAQIERDGGFGPGAIANAETGATAGQEAVKYAKSLARRKAMSIVALDIGLMYIGNSLLQSGANVLLNDGTLDKELHGYAQRFADMLTHVREHPLSLLQPFDLMQRLSSTYENEPGKQDRIKIGYAKDGTAIYARNPAGKIADEFIGYMTGPLDMMRRKLGTIARPAWQVMSNDAGFGRKIYDPNADTPQKYLANLGFIAKHFAGSQLPEGQLSAGVDLVKGEGDSKVNALQALGPVAGVTFAKGAPGGPAVGELYQARTEHDFEVQKELPDIRRQIQRGDIAGAQERMTALKIPGGLQKFYIRSTLNPSTRLGGRTLRDFYLYATPEQRERLLSAH